ncbi:MAG TPA: helix-turn-helix domain-containing protein [Oligoflexia bacterium]|nr:helix-turn-helix domain-containing protein [Oligoflexia bacterium]
MNIPPPKGMELIDTLALTYTDASGGLKAKDLMQLFGLTRSSVSSFLSKLEKKNFIEYASIKNDSRSKIILLKNEKPLLEKLRRYNTDISIQGSRTLEHKECIRLAQYLLAISHKLGASKEPAWSYDFPLVEAQFKLASVLNMLNKSYMGTDYDLLSFHLLYELSKSKEGTEISFLTKILPFSAPNISRALLGFASSRMIKKQTSSADARVILVIPEQKLFNEYNRIQSPIEKKLMSATTEFTEQKLHDCIHLLFKIGSDAHSYSKTSPDQIRICACENDYERARVLLARYLLGNKEEQCFGKSFISGDYPLAYIENKGQLESLVEIAFVNGRFITGRSFGNHDSVNTLINELKKYLASSIKSL